MDLTKHGKANRESKKIDDYEKEICYEGGLKLHSSMASDFWYRF